MGFRKKISEGGSVFLKIRTALLKIPKLLMVFAWFSLALMLVGYSLNLLVRESNGGKMPVAMGKEDILFVIGPAEFGVKYFIAARAFEEFWPKHQPLTQDMKFRVLADRIPILVIIVQRDTLPNLIFQTFDFLDIPINKEGIASIGDLILWSGKWLALPIIPSLSVCLILGIFLKFRKKT